MSLLGNETPGGVPSPSASFRLLIRLPEEGGGRGKLDCGEGLSVPRPTTSGMTAGERGLFQSLKRPLCCIDRCVPQPELSVPSHSAHLKPPWGSSALNEPQEPRIQPCAYFRPPHLPACTSQHTRPRRSFSLSLLCASPTLHPRISRSLCYTCLTFISSLASLHRCLSHRYSALASDPLPHSSQVLFFQPLLK